MKRLGIKLLFVLKNILPRQWYYNMLKWGAKYYWEKWRRMKYMYFENRLKGL